MNTRIILTTINARYIHTAFGLRYLYANMAELQAESKILEFSIKQQALEICEQLYLHQPQIIGFGVYIWNVAEITAVIALLKQILPETILIVGGPEVSHPPDLPDLVNQVDYVLTGQADLSFAQLCQQIVAGNRPEHKIIASETPVLKALASPYPYYTDLDIQQRIIYVEASRGCPYKCEFCLSALDVTAKAFELNGFLSALEQLYQRGARQFKFIDRTFNLKVDVSIAILEFFLVRLNENLHLHFEIIPDHLPDALKNTIKLFPPGVLQFEIGVQTFVPAVQQLISRKQDNDKAANNIAWIRQNTHAHIHADLIVGLPGDTLAGFAESFDKLVTLKPQEIQVGVLKRLRGAPINRHNDHYAMRYEPHPPYTVLSTANMDFLTLQRLKRFARYWDLIANSGRFSATLPYLLAEQPFNRFMQLSDAIYCLAGTTWKISLKRLFELVYTVMTEHLQITVDESQQLLLQDFQRTSEKGRLEFLADKIPVQNKAAIADKRQRRF